jgi:hypothetical protein
VAMQDEARLGTPMLDIPMRGVSTRQYRAVIPEMADRVDVSRSSVRIPNEGEPDSGVNSSAPRGPRMPVFVLFFRRPESNRGWYDCNLPS